MSDDYGTTEREQSTIQFPYTDMDDAIAVAKKMMDAGSIPLDRDQLAGIMGQVPRSGAFGAKVAAARMFGLIDNVGGKYQITELGFEILDPQRAPAARGRSFLHVPLYLKLYEDFKGRQLPPKGPALEKLLVGMGVAPKQKDRARRTFEASARIAGFFNPSEDRLIMPVAATHTLIANGINEEKKTPLQPPPPAPPPPPASAHHPFIEGLLKTLPPVETNWPAERRAKWLEAASNIFDLIYKDEAGGDAKVIVIELKGDALT